MNKFIYLIVLILYFPSSSFCWNRNPHREMTKAAAKQVLRLDDKTLYTVSVKVKYNMLDDFFTTICAGIDMGAGGIISSAIGAIADVAISETKYEIDTSVDIKDSTELDIMTECGHEPDWFDAGTGLFGEGDCMVGHMYTPNGLGFADYMTDYFYKKAVTSYKAGSKLEGLAYLGFASHYLADVGLPIHEEADYLNQKNIQLQKQLHGAIEDWSETDWPTLQATVDSAAKCPMPACDIQGMVRGLGLETYPKLAEWYNAWDVKSGLSKPKYESNFRILEKEAIWRIVPRITGLFMRFKKEVNYSSK